MRISKWHLASAAVVVALIALFGLMTYLGDLRSAGLAIPLWAKGTAGFGAVGALVTAAILSPKSGKTRDQRVIPIYVEEPRQDAGGNDSSSGTF